MKIQHRIQDWLADRVSWVQYPHIRPANPAARATSRTGFKFKYAMPFGKRIDLFLFSLLLLLIGLVAAGGTLLFAYLFFSSLT